MQVLHEVDEPGRVYGLPDHVKAKVYARRHRSAQIDAAGLLLPHPIGVYPIAPSVVPRGASLGIADSPTKNARTSMAMASGKAVAVRYSVTASGILPARWYTGRSALCLAPPSAPTPSFQVLEQTHPDIDRAVAAHETGIYRYQAIGEYFAMYHAMLRQIVPKAMRPGQN